MKVVQESFTVVPDAAAHEVAILLAGMRITFGVDEARRLAADLSKALLALGGEGRKANGANGIVAPVESRDIGAELRSAADEMKRVPSLPRAG
jgi:hypothetical protein